MKEKPAGTANILNQNAIYENLCGEYSLEVAMRLLVRVLSAMVSRCHPKGAGIGTQ